MAGKLQFVVLKHEGVDPPHYDLMFETIAGGQLATWRSDVWPVVEDTPLVHLPDHRRQYLTYQGPVSNDRGHVRRVAEGTCQIEQSIDADTGHACWRVILFEGAWPPRRLILWDHRDGTWRASTQWT